jgi:hypothetical protein
MSEIDKKATLVFEVKIDAIIPGTKKIRDKERKFLKRGMKECIENGMSDEFSNVRVKIISAEKPEGNKE